MPKVVVIGSANMDLTVRLERLPQLGETVSGGEFYTSFGGKGANQAVAAHKAGAQVRFVGKVGCDQNGEAIINQLEALGLISDRILRDESHHSGVALIIVDRTGNNAIAVAPGSNRNLTEEDINRAESLISWGEVVLAQLEVPLVTVRQALHLAKDHGLVTILNPAPARPLPAEILCLADILTPNETEAGALAGFSVMDLNEATRAARRLLESGAGQVIVTRGSGGSCWVQKDCAQVFPSFPVTAVDSTAAGAITVTRKGAQDSLPAKDEIEDLLIHYEG